MRVYHFKQQGVKIRLLSRMSQRTIQTVRFINEQKMRCKQKKGRIYPRNLVCISFIFSAADFDSHRNRCRLGAIIFQSTASFISINVLQCRIYSRMVSQNTGNVFSAILPQALFFACSEAFVYIWVFISCKCWKRFRNCCYYSLPLIGPNIL